MTHEEVLDLFRHSGALLEGHFKLSSGLHSTGYLQCALVLQDPARAEALGAALGAMLKTYEANVVLSPALGGLIIGHEVARALGGGSAAVGNLAVRAIFVERVEKTLTLRRGFTLAPSDRVVVIEDVVTTGLSTRETIDAAKAYGATIVAAGSIIDRNGKQDLGVPYHALSTLVLPTYQPDGCPMCAAGSPVTKPGSRT